MFSVVICDNLNILAMPPKHLYSNTDTKLRTYKVFTTSGRNGAHNLFSASQIFQPKEFYEYRSMEN
jgi:hypothetical protein